MNSKSYLFSWIAVASLIQLVASNAASKKAFLKLEHENICEQLGIDILSKIKYSSARELSEKHKERLDSGLSSSEPDEAINKLHNLIKEWTKKWKEVDKSDPSVFSKLKWNKYRILSDLGAAITYAHFHLAKLYLKTNQVLAAFIEIQHVIGLRKEYQGVNMEQVKLIEGVTRLSLKFSCDGDLYRVLGSNRGLDEACEHLKELSTQPELLRYERTESALSYSRKLADTSLALIRLQEREFSSQ